MRLKEKVAIVTGAANGIGAEISRTFAHEGCHVVLADLAAEQAAALVAEITHSTGIKAISASCNVAKKEELQRVVDACVAEFGTVDILVNNAGISAREPLYQYDPAAFKNIMDLNVTAVFNGCRAVAPIMKAQGGGSIINTSSMVSLYGQPSGVGYPTSKFAVNGLTRSLARELGRDNIRVNAVAPGVTRTDMVANLPEEMVKRVCAPIPLQRMGEPQEVANAFLFLASDLASYVTGEILSVDGAAQT